MGVKLEITMPNGAKLNTAELSVAEPSIAELNVAEIDAIDLKTMKRVKLKSLASLFGKKKKTKDREY